MNFLKPFCVCCFLLILNSCHAQTTYYFNWKNDGGLLLASGIVTGLGIHYRSQTPILTIDAIESLKKSDVRNFDRKAIDYYSGTADSWSDVFWGGTHLLPVLFLSSKKYRGDFTKIGVMYGEVFLLNAGITGLAKYTFRRSRPFVYNSLVDIEEKLTKTARTSFFSGHTSMTAANCFFMAKVFADVYPESSWRPIIWTGAAVIPALTGYLRIRAGKHFPTDTIAGYAVGAAIGVLIPHLHKRPSSRVAISGGINGVALNWRFLK